MLVLDIETNADRDRIWLCCTLDTETGESLCHTIASSLEPLIAAAAQVIAHNGIGFDFPILEKLWKVSMPVSKMIDTLILSRLYRPDLADGHSLESWGRNLGVEKQSYSGDYKRWTMDQGNEYHPLDEWNRPNLEMMEAYCKQDLKVTLKLYTHLENLMGQMGFSEQSKTLERDVAVVVQKQMEAGVFVNERGLMELKAELDAELATLENRLMCEFEPTIVVMKTKTKLIPFNPGSRMQIADRLKARGWKPKSHTEKGNIIIDEEVLDTIDMPEAKLFSRYFMLQKRVSQVKQWAEALHPDSRIRGRVITNGAVTGRMTHSGPNMAQVPSNDKEYGRECRALFTAPPGRVLVGVDASGLELRMLAHYMQDEEYTTEVCDGDVHTKNMKAAGLATRPQAKTFVYAFLYGAGPEKIGNIVGGGAKEGRKLINSFLKATPAISALREKIGRMLPKGGGTLPGLDGRRLHIRSDHAALNTLLQGAGAILMKKAVVLLDQELTSLNIDATIVLNVHDEWQIECIEADAKTVGQLAVTCIEAAGTILGLRCPVTGEYHVGRSWADTH